MEEVLFANGGRHCGFRSAEMENFQNSFYAPISVIFRPNLHFSPSITSGAHFFNILTKGYLLLDEEKTLEKTETLSLKFS